MIQQIVQFVEVIELEQPANVQLIHLMLVFSQFAQVKFISNIIFFKKKLYFFKCKECNYKCISCSGSTINCL